jgi:hypothetical protein
MSAAFQEVLEAEMTEVLSAENGERTPAGGLSRSDLDHRGCQSLSSACDRTRIPRGKVRLWDKLGLPHAGHDASSSPGPRSEPVARVAGVNGVNGVIDKV